MNTTAINVSTEAYNQAADYARAHNTSVEKMMEQLIFTFLIEKKMEKKIRPTSYSSELLKLVGIAKNASNIDDLNGDEARWEYLKERYQLR